MSYDELRRSAPSGREPQLTPPDHVWTVLQDYGPGDGGWGPATVAMPLVGVAPIIYSGNDPTTIAALKTLCRLAAQDTGKPTRLVRYTTREDVYVVGGSS